MAEQPSGAAGSSQNEEQTIPVEDDFVLIHGGGRFGQSLTVETNDISTK